MYTLSDAAMKLIKHDLKVILDDASHHVSLPSDEKYIRSSNFEVDSRLHPADFFHFQFQSKYIYLHYTQHVYTICCEHFIPRHLPPFRSKNVNLEIYRNFFGEFDSFDIAVHAFVDVVHEALDYCVSNEVEFYQLEIF